MTKVHFQIAGSIDGNRRRVLAAGLVLTLLPSFGRRAFARHKRWHRRVIAPSYVSTLADNLKRRPEFAELDLDVTFSESDEQTLAILRGAPAGEFDLVYSCGAISPNLDSPDAFVPLEPGKLPHWSSVLDPLKSSPLVQDASGKVRTVPTDWAFYSRP